MKQGGTRNGVGNNIWEMKDHGVRATLTSSGD